jgi:flagellum-specific peptidoglycan hydrolase FlgJ
LEVNVKRKKLYLFLAILTVVFLFATAAVCNQRGIQTLEKEDTESTEKESSKKEESKSASEDEKKDENKDEKKEDEPKPEDKKNDDENKLPVIAGIYLDGLDPIDYFFFVGETYTVRAEATDPEGSSLTFKWSGDGTIASGDLNPMTWTAPDSESVYKITVEVTDEKGGTAKGTADVNVVEGKVGDVLITPEIGKIEVRGADDNGRYYTNNIYNIHVNVKGPDNMVKYYHYTVSGGKKIEASANTMKWETPDTEGDYIITVEIYDKDQVKLDEKSKTVTVEVEWIVVE